MANLLKCEANLLCPVLYAMTRADLRRKELGGRSPTGALKALFAEKKILYRAKWEGDDEELAGLVFTFPELMGMTAQFWEVVLADVTKVARHAV